MKNYDTVIFDLDGTLLNTLEDLTDSVNYAMDKYGFHTRTIDEVRRFVGNGLKKLMDAGIAVLRDRRAVSGGVYRFLRTLRRKLRKEDVSLCGDTGTARSVKRAGHEACHCIQ